MKMKNKLNAEVIWAMLFIGIFLFTAADVLGENFKVAVEGEPKATIVTGEDPVPVVKFAASELKLYLEKITGGSFQIVDSKSQSGNAIVLGDTKYTRAAGIDVENMDRGEFVVKVRDKTIFIAGRDAKGQQSERIFSLKEDPDKDLSWGAGRNHFRPDRWDFEKATLFGVYDFLQDQAGVRWFFPGPKGEVVPEKKDLSVSIDTHRSKPYFPLRQLGRWYWPGDITEVRPGMYVRPVESEYDDLRWTAKRNKLWQLRMGGVGRWMAFNHRPKRHWWLRRFGEDHPEYFALLHDGRRDMPENLDNRQYRYHLCYTNPGVYKETIEDARAFFSGKEAESRGIPHWNLNASYKDTFSLLPGDSFKACRCGDCRPLLNEEGEWSSLSSDLVWGFVKKVAQELKAEFPDKYFTNLAYSSFTMPPKSFDKLPENVIVGFCPHRVDGSYQLNKTFNLVNHEMYRTFKDLMREWDAYNDNPLIVWLHHLYRWRGQNAYIPMHIPHQLGRLIKDLKAHNAKYLFFQLDADSVFYDHINRYVMQKLMWNPELEVDALIDDYIRNFYGEKAYDPVQEFLADVEAKCMEIAEKGAGRLTVWGSYFDAEAIQKYEKLLQDALNLTQGTEYHQNVKNLEKYFLGGIKKGYDEMKETLEASKTTGTVPIFQVEENDIKVDGVIDEDAWDESQGLDLVNNINQEETTWDTNIRLLYGRENIYFAFDCYSPNIQEDMAGKAFEHIELFFDPNHDRDSYYQILINNNGEVRDYYYEGGGEQRNAAWQSGVVKEIEVRDDGWTIEGAIPLKNLGVEKVKEGEVWGMNVGRHIPNPPQEEETWNTFSRLITASFHQPDYFARMYFLKEKEERTAPAEDNLFDNGAFEKWEDDHQPASWRTATWGGSTVNKDDAIVRSGQYSARIDTSGAGALIKKTIRSPGTPPRGDREILEDGKYRLSFYWYTPNSAKCGFRFYIREPGEEEIFRNLDIDTGQWTVVERDDRDFKTFGGDPNTWNREQFEFTLESPRSYGVMDILGYRGGEDGTIFIDNVTLSKVK